MLAALLALLISPAFAAPKAAPAAVRQGFLAKPIDQVLGDVRAAIARPASTAFSDENRAQGGEFVRVGAPGSRVALYRSADADDDGRVRVVEIPLIGKFKGRFDGDRDVVVLPLGNEVFHAAVPRAAIETLHGPYPAQKVGVALKGALSGGLSFTRGESVRFRHEGLGDVRPGIFETLLRLPDGRKAVVLDETGGRQLVPASRVYKWTGGDPGTPVWTFPKKILWTPFSHRDHLTGLFLHAAARFTSHPEYLAADALRRAELVGGFVDAVVTADVAATFAELAGVKGFDGVLALGRGVCRHLAPLAAAVLREAGADAALAYWPLPSDVGNLVAEGHAWIELGGKQPGVLDPMERRLVVRPDIELEKADPRSFAARFYTKPDRVVDPGK